MLREKSMRRERISERDREGKKEQILRECAKIKNPS